MNHRIKLTEIREDDSLILFRWINDPVLVTFNSNYSPVHYVNHSEWIEKILKNKQMTIFAIRLNDGTLIGTCQLHSINNLNGTAELQIRIGEIEFQSKGYGSEAIKQLIEYGFNNLNLRKVYLHVFSDNNRAIKAYKKCGFVTEGTLKEHIFIDGKFKSLDIMSHFRT